MAAIEVAAPAKVNLTLHVTGRRADGYHLLDSLVAFADLGDTIRVTRADRLSLSVSGPFAAAVPPGADNLVLRAARWLAPDRCARIDLVKMLPVAAGLGGGSADAAAALRALARLWNLPLPAPADTVALGADIPVCLAGHSAIMRGIGAEIAATDIPALAAVLVNPGVAVPTAEAFRRLARSDNPPMAPPCPDARDRARFTGWLAAQRNDVEAPARGIAPEIGTALTALADAPGCRLARMSGSGATCFGLFDGAETASGAADALRRARPGWWVAATTIAGAPVASRSSV